MHAIWIADCPIWLHESTAVEEGGAHKDRIKATLSSRAAVNIEDGPMETRGRVMDGGNGPPEAICANKSLIDSMVENENEE